MTKQAMRTIIFSILIILELSILSRILIPNWNEYFSRINTFYHQPKNSLDVIFIGSSSFLRGILPLTIWEDYGFTSYNRSTAVQSPYVTYSYLMETLKYQNPKVVVIDAIWLFNEYDVDKNESWLRYAVDTMKLSPEKISLIFEITTKSNHQSFLSYLFPIFRYHTRWNELSESDFLKLRTFDYDPYKGAAPLAKTCDCEIPENYMSFTNQKAELDKESIKIFNKIINYCKKNNINLYFVTLPRLQNWNYSRYLAAKAYAEENHITYIDYNYPELFEEVGFSPKADFYDSNHLNLFGGMKVSKHIGSYLQNTNELPSKNGEFSLEVWNKDLIKFETYKLNFQYEPID
jgi:hypothetical protein